MARWRESKNFFPQEDDPEKGDLVIRVVDPRQAYYMSVPVNADDEVEGSQYAKHFVVRDKVPKGPGG